MTTYALDTSNDASEVPSGLAVLRYLDLIVLVLALVLFALAGLPLLGYAVAAAAWIVQRGIDHLATSAAERSSHPRAIVGVLVASMIGRGWLVAGSILAVGLVGSREDGLAAAVLSIGVFTVYFVSQLVVRPADEAARKAEGGSAA